ncbi:SET domain-containing protein [Rhizosphaericola mali]|uniref:SET domain-containing protein n=1 Tax=Rhizosphaericola mali TaxID=2545455 RepID=A0A5P2G6S7_9BACT|nr:SET domain-containing protein [Rhizosphaericola mali]QES87211.1 SET domain-containing protein [Rhizosphaericola mali]
MILPFLTIAASPLGGKGVFTSENIPADTIIEVSPVIELTPEERAHVEKTELFNYIFEWGDEYKGAAVALGYVSMYNHSYHASCVYEMDFEENEIRVRTVKDVKAGEEVTINYNADPDDETPIWFEAK